jgi:hypothetical protein
VSGQLHTLSALHPQKERLYPLKRRMGGLQDWSAKFGELKILLLLSGIESLIIQPIAQSLFQQSSSSSDTWEVKINFHLPVICHRQDRMELLRIHTQGTRLSLSRSDWQVLQDRTDGYSGCDIANLISSALLEPMRDMVKATHWITSSCKYKIHCRTLALCFMLYVPCILSCV